MLAKYSSLVLVIFFWWQIRGFFSHADPTVRCRGEEREALFRFKRGLLDPSNRLSSWVGEDCCAWQGVRCHNITRHVTSLSLRNLDQNPDVLRYSDDNSGAASVRSRFSGNISRSLTQLKQLQHLDLSQNNFGGAQVPEFFGSLSNLRYLNLSSSYFGGTIPPQLGNLSSLICLALGDRHYSGMDAYKGLDWISHLSSLEFLDLNGIYLKNVSNWLQMVNMLPSLSELHMSNCGLDSATPLSHVNFSSLAVLDLSWNSLDHSVLRLLIQGLPPVLSSLDLSYNSYLAGPIPNYLRNMTGIQSLRLANNRFNSTIPGWLYNYTSLEILDLSGNDFRGTISKAIGRLSSLEELNLSDNGLAGEIPESIKNLCNLRVLDLKMNSLVGCVSKYIGYLSSCMKERLEKLSLHSNQVSGSLPDKLRDFRRLSHISFSSCRLTGTIPESIGHLSKLEVLEISNNSLVGTVSQVHFKNLTRLRVLSVGANQNLSFQFDSNWTPPFQLHALNMSNTRVGPQFPAWLRSQKYLKILVMSDAGISLPIPTWISSLPHLHRLDLSNNHIPGSIPNLTFREFSYRSYGMLIFLGSNDLSGPLPLISSTVSVLDLSNNSISGSLAPFLCQSSTNLLFLDLSKNLLFGELTDCWANWESLLFLKLSHNNFTGEIPRSMHSLSRLRFLHLRKNKLSGILPQNLQNWSCNLQVIDLSENEISGSLPGSMPEQFAVSLQILALRSNRLTGIILPELCQLESLQILDLANNRLSKTIPKCLSNLKAMVPDTGHPHYVLSNFLSFSDDYSIVISRMETFTLVVKNRDLEYNINNLELVTSIDLSCNSLSGEIPKELTNLQNLRSLNLSSNHLKGKMPVRMGNMKLLESLDLSMNQLSGEIPQGIANLNFLSSLNLSYNNLSGRIPLGTQIQGFSFSFIGNNELCGPPITNYCLGDHVPDSLVPSLGDGNENKEVGDGWINMKWLYLGIPFGFVVGFWGILLPLALNRAWRFAYFRFLDELKDRII